MITAKNVLPFHDELFGNNEILSETVNGKKYWYIKGIFMQANIVNRNNRLYPKDILDNATNVYVTQFVNKRRAVGELTHPDTTKINPDRISHLTEEIKIDGIIILVKQKF